MNANVQPRYRVTELGTLGGPESQACAINNCGQIVGGADVSEGVQHAFLWQDGCMTDLNPSDSKQSVALSINERRQIVGSIDGADGLGRACLWDRGTMTLLDGPGGVRGSVNCINDAGQCVGQHDRKIDPYYGGPSRAVLWDGAKTVELCTLKQFGEDFYERLGSYACGINNAGQIVGSAPNFSAFLWDAGEITLIEFALDCIACAYAINNQGQVVGGGEVREAIEHAFLWESGSITDLGTLGGPRGIAFGINDRGEIVGRSFTTKTDSDGDPVEEHGFLWRDGLLMDLNTLIPPDSGWVIMSAKGINDTGQIVGEGIHKGRARAVLLTPM